MGDDRVVTVRTHVFEEDPTLTDLYIPAGRRGIGPRRWCGCCGFPGGGGGGAGKRTVAGAASSGARSTPARIMSSPAAPPPGHIVRVGQ